MKRRLVAYRKLADGGSAPAFALPIFGLKNWDEVL